MTQGTAARVKLNSDSDVNQCTTMKHRPKVLCRDYDLDISQRLVSCLYLRKLVYDKFQMALQASLS